MSTLADKLTMCTDGTEAPLYVDDVFSAYLYTGNGSTQTITNGIDLAGEGGLVWIKGRNAARGSYLFDTVRGADKYIASETTAAQVNGANRLTSFSGSGFVLGNDPDVNYASATQVSWTFRKAPKFFDVVTYTGNGVAGRQIAHSLGVAPGMVIIKSTTRLENWYVWHRGTTGGYYLSLNTTGAETNSLAAAVFGNGTITVDPTLTHVYLGANVAVNGTGESYVAYLFAHDTEDDGLIQCGSFTTNGSGNATVELGWEPQYLMIKMASNAGYSWQIADSMRGMSVASITMGLDANSSGAESGMGVPFFVPNATGFSFGPGAASKTYIYLAIRRPNKPPESGTEVFSVSSGNRTSLTGGSANDLAVWKRTDSSSYSNLQWGFSDRLRGISPWTTWTTTSTTTSPVLYSHSTGAEVTNASRAGQYPGTSGAGGGNPNAIMVMMDDGSSASGVGYFFRRAPGFMDIVCYTGTGSAHTEAHNLGVVPELILIKKRDSVLSSYYFHVGCGGLGWTKFLEFPDNGEQTLLAIWNNTVPTSTVFSIGTYAGVNYNTSKYVAYLFATLPGISKVGSYTGNGSSQTIDCGFAAGARFILVKRTDAAGDWFVWDSVRGIVAGNDPHISLNTTAAEVTGDDSIDPTASGFIVNQISATNINVTSANYIFLAIA